jgi:hypothetical protein
MRAISGGRLGRNHYRLNLQQLFNAKTPWGLVAKMTLRC